MKLLLKRIALRDTYTIGKIYIDGEYFCDTLEDKVRDLNKNGVFDGDEKKVYGETAIPYGTYKVILSYSPKFKRILPELLDVPCFTGIRIHRGNTEKDTAGCLLVGENKVRGKVLNSTYWEKKLIEKLEGKNGITIQIV
ncbi:MULTISPECIES: DUF5675 family protein [unclassified Bacteroides]|jgi:hypothetical protein|uniref:DUF5675 family protein n=1 Tax=unclassified Bacteroides TaxID=2646097 RepID=UPI000E88992F|nr:MULTISPECIES: DUF5675 family protein [unclassified Bacteroides]RGN50927.1 hypothetical protein DXB63_03365 [Bacteroides sp. OM05-12]RHR82214.1 hypothetical protein DWW69_02215 [Bacteroides sp. AF16-49]